MYCIQEATLFRGMSQDCLNGLSRIMRDESYKEGSFIFKEGDPADTLYVLEDGKVHLSVGAHGHVVYLVSKQGEAFGWSSLVVGENYTATAECITPCSVITIDKEALEGLFAAHLPDGILFYKRLAENIGQRLLNCYNALLSAQKEERQPSYG